MRVRVCGRAVPVAVLCRAVLGRRRRRPVARRPSFPFGRSASGRSRRRPVRVPVSAAAVAVASPAPPCSAQPPRARALCAWPSRPPPSSPRAPPGRARPWPVAVGLGPRRRLGGAWPTADVAGARGRWTRRQTKTARGPAAGGRDGRRRQTSEGVKMSYVCPSSVRRLSAPCPLRGGAAVR